MPAIIDLEFQGLRHVIATAVIPVGGGVLLVDPGPTSCLPVLERGLQALSHSLADVRGLLLTHIHLDHAGAAGTIARRLPGVPVYVHEVGARHLERPEKLLASATRLYGADMDRLWGAFEAVPAPSLRPLSGGEALEVAGRRFEVAYTPGHAVHHVSYLDTANGTAYVGDTAGIRVSPGYTMVATPPPDIDVERWNESLDRIAAWKPSRLFLTHFGEGDVPATHLAAYRDTLRRSAEAVKRGLDAPGTDESRVAAWRDWLRQEMQTLVPAEAMRAAEAAAPFDQLWQGLARYWRKRAA